MLSDPIQDHCGFPTIGGVAAVFHFEASLVRIGQGVSRRNRTLPFALCERDSGDGSSEDFGDPDVASRDRPPGLSGLYAIEHPTFYLVQI